MKIKKVVKKMYGFQNVRIINNDYTITFMGHIRDIPKEYMDNKIKEITLVIHEGRPQMRIVVK